MKKVSEDIVNGKSTWVKPNGEWGVGDVDLSALPPAVYQALHKLKEIEHPGCPEAAPEV